MPENPTPTQPDLCFWCAGPVDEGDHSKCATGRADADAAFKARTQAPTPTPVSLEGLVAAPDAQAVATRLVILRDWLIEGASPYNHEGELVFLRNIISDLEKYEAALRTLQQEKAALLNELERVDEVLRAFGFEGMPRYEALAKLPSSKIEDTAGDETPTEEGT